MNLPDDLDKFLQNLLAKTGPKFSDVDLEYIKTILEAVLSGEPSVLAVMKKDKLKFIVTGTQAAVGIQILSQVITDLSKGLEQ